MRPCNFFIFIRSSLNNESRYSPRSHGWIRLIFSLDIGAEKGGYWGGRECRDITYKWEVYGAPRTVRDLYISVCDALVKGIEAKANTAISIVDLVDIMRGLGIAHVPVFKAILACYFAAIPDLA